MEKKLTVLLHENGTVQIIPEDGSSNQQRWISGVFLLLGFCFGVGLGLVTLLGLRTKFCPRSLIGLQVVALLDCIQGQTLGIIFLASKPSDFLCRFSACTSTSLLITETIQIAILTFPPQNLLIDVSSWIIGGIVAFSIAVDHQQTPVNFFPSRNSCSVVNAGGHSLLSTGAIVVFGSCWLGTAAGLMQGSICRENNFDVIISRIITVLYIVLVLPIALVLLISLTNKPQINNHNSNNNNELAESVFIWARYQLNIALPIIILLFNKQVRKQSETILCWFRKNSIGQIPHRNKNNETIFNLNKRKTRNKIFNKKSNPLTPVLFATSNGLHLRMMDNNLAERPSTSSETKDATLIICEQCDLTQNTILSLSKASTIRPAITGIAECRKNVRFVSPQISGTGQPSNESGVWSNKEDAEAIQLNLHRILPQGETEHRLGITYSKV